VPKRRRRSFTPQFKAQVVLEVLSGQRSASESVRQHKLKPELISRWKDIALEGLEGLFQGDDQQSRDQDRIAKLERMVGRLTMELEVAKKSLDLAPLGPEARREVVLMLAAEYPVRLICRATGWPRSSVYHDAAPAGDEGRLRRALGRLAARWPTYGYRRLTVMLRREGWAVNGKRVRRLMAEMGLRGEAPARRRRTTDSRHDFPRYPNLVDGLEVTRPDQVWVADITYVRLREEFVYLAVLMDVFTRRVRGWELGRGLDQGLTLAALKRALRRGRRPEVHPPTRGCSTPPRLIPTCWPAAARRSAWRRSASRRRTGSLSA
jgi:transposase-like protein